MKTTIFYTTCSDNKEADKISKSLLEKKLIVCAKKFPVSSTYLWKSKIENAEEIMLILESVEENFEKVKEEIKKLHSYETFILYSIPVKTTKEVENWIDQELK